MAIDTLNEKLALLGEPLPVSADGLDLADLQQLIGGYPGIPWEPPVPEPEPVAPPPGPVRWGPPRERRAEPPQIGATALLWQDGQWMSAVVEIGLEGQAGLMQGQGRLVARVAVVNVNEEEALLRLLFGKGDEGW